MINQMSTPSLYPLNPLRARARARARSRGTRAIGLELWGYS